VTPSFTVGNYSPEPRHPNHLGEAGALWRDHYGPTHPVLEGMKITPQFTVRVTRTAGLNVDFNVRVVIPPFHLHAIFDLGPIHEIHNSNTITFTLPCTFRNGIVSRGDIDFSGVELNGLDGPAVASLPGLKALVNGAISREARDELTKMVDEKLIKPCNEELTRFQEAANRVMRGSGIFMTIGAVLGGGAAVVLGSPVIVAAVVGGVGSGVVEPANDALLLLFGSLLASHSPAKQMTALTFLSKATLADPTHRHLTLTLILTCVSANFSSLSPKTVHDSNLLSALIAVSQNDSNPLILSTAFLIFSLLIPLTRTRLSSTEINSLLSVSLHAVHWEVVCSAVLKATKSGKLADTLLRTQTEWSLDEMEEMDFILQMRDLDESDESWGISSALQSILDPQAPPISSNPLANLTSTSLRQSVDAVFTVIYALFPHLTLDSIRLMFSAGVNLSWAQELKNRRANSFVAAMDPFRAPMERILELEVLEEGMLVRQRICNLVKAHRMHPLLVFATRQEEMQLIQQGADRSAGEILVECFLMRSATPPSASTTAPPRIDRDSVTAQDSAPIPPTTATNTLPPPVASLPPPTSPAVTLLASQLKYETCLVSTCMSQIAALKREKRVQDVNLIDRDNIYQKLRSQQQEIHHLTTTLSQLRAESASTRDRHRTHESDLHARIQASRLAAREAKDAAVEAASAVARKEAEVNELRGELDVRAKRIHGIEQELHLVEPELERLEGCEEALKAVTNKFVQRELDSCTREFLKQGTETLESSIFELELALSSSERQAQHFQARIRELEFLVSTTSSDPASSSSREVIAEKLEESAAQHAKAMESLRAVNLERVRGVEEKYQTVRRLNVALMTRVVELEAGREDIFLALVRETSLVTFNNAIRLDPTFSDVLLLVGPSKTPVFAHANILSQNCEYYATALSQRWDDSVALPDGVEIDKERSKSLRAVLSHPDVEIETIYAILEFVYTGSAEIPDPMILKVALFPHQLLLPFVKNLCLEHFADNVLSPKNAFEFYILCDTLGHRKFKHKTLWMASSNMPEAVNCGRTVLHDMTGDQLGPAMRFPGFLTAEKWRLLIGWAKAQQSSTHISLEAGIGAPFDIEQARDDIAELVPAVGVFSLTFEIFKLAVVPYLPIFDETTRSLLR
ncbi:hypothetical protein HDU98_009411, partial [Podochytrium sp. JEL0797]